jgi:(S)-2-hydroxyglutarate dehydrogenase
MRYAVVGGGIVGLSIALAILEKKLGSVTIFDKETKLGSHASTRNSGVIHSGIYYSSDSLKAKFSVIGNQEIKKICMDNGLQLLDTGKLILSQNIDSERQLGVLEKRGLANGVPLQRLDRTELGSFAPGALTHESFIRVLSTAVANPGEVFTALLEKYFALGGSTQVSAKVKVKSPSDSESLKINGQKFDFLINAAGAGAVELAKPFGVGLDYLVTPFLGVYWGVETKKLPLQMPLYPTPHPINPFLGVHLTPTPYGYTKIGPSAIPVLGKEQYNWHTGISPKDLFESLRAYSRIAFGESHSLTQMVKSEFPKFFLKTMISEASSLLPRVRETTNWKPIPAGIRAQLVDRNGELVQDFVVEKGKNSVHVLNAVSPGWTSAIPFGRWIVDEHLSS